MKSLSVRKSTILLVIKITLLEVSLELLFLFLIWSTQAIRSLVGNSEIIFISIIYVFIRLLQVFVVVGLFLDWMRDKFNITDTELILTQGSKKVIYPLNNIESVRIERSWFGKLFNYGSIYIKPQRVDTEIVLDGIDHVDQVATKIELAMVKFEGK